MQSGKVNIFVLHGWAVSAQNQQKWQNFLDLLKKSGHIVQFLPLPGLSKPLAQPWTMSDFVEWLDGELERHHSAENSQSKSTSKIILLGHSFGGHISIKYAAKNPDKISGLILIDSSGLRDHSLKMKLKRGIFKTLAKTGKFMTNSAWARNALYKLARERDYLQADPVLKKTMSQILTQEVTDDLASVKAPTKIIWGSQDQVTPLILAHRLQAGISQSSLEIVDGARHSPQFTHPEQVVKIINQFLQDL